MYIERLATIKIDLLATYVLASYVYVYAPRVKDLCLKLD